VTAAALDDGDERRDDLRWNKELLSGISMVMKIPQILACFFMLLSLSRAQVPVPLKANFDELSEGSIGPTFSSGGILFSDYDNRAEGSPPVGQIPFAVEMTTNSISGFSPSNFLAFGGLSSGPSAAFSRMGSFRMSCAPTLAQRVDFDLFSYQVEDEAVAYELLAFNGSILVASNSIPIAPVDPQGAFIRRQHLTLACVPPFDSLFVQTLPTNTVDFISMDNVEFAPVGFVAPAPRLRRLDARGPHVNFEIAGYVGRQITLEASTNLIQWQSLMVTNIPYPGTFTVREPRAHAHRFYRLLQDDCH